jgi:uncharacterized RDD family membrane protein YckC
MFCASCGSNLNPGATFCPNCGTPQPAQPVQPAQPAAGYPAPSQAGGAPFSPSAAVQPSGYPAVFAAGYATWSTRALGAIVDALLVGAGMAVLYLIFGVMVASMAGGVLGHNAGGSMCCMFLVLFPVATLLVGLYNGVYLIATRGYSIGQGVVKVKVVDVNGNLLTTGTALIRLLARAAMGFVPLLPMLDLLWPLWDSRFQTLHDKAVNCYVVNNPQGY